MAKNEVIWEELQMRDLAVHLREGDLVTTPLGTGEVCGLVDCNGVQTVVVNHGETMNGVICVRSYPADLVTVQGLNLRAALKRAMESTLDPLQGGGAP